MSAIRIIPFSQKKNKAGQLFVRVCLPVFLRGLPNFNTGFRYTNSTESKFFMPDKKSKAELSPDDRKMHINLALLSLAVMIDVLGFSIIIPLVPEYVRQGLHLPSVLDPRIGEYSGWLTASYALMQFLFAPIWGALSDRIGRKQILIGSLVGDAVFYTLFGLSAHSIEGQFAARILAGIFSSASLSVAQAYAADITPPHLRAMGLGYLGAAFGVGFILGPALGGLLGQIGLSVPLYVSAAVALMNLIYIAFKLPEPVRETPSASAETTPTLGRFARMTQAVTGPVGFLYLLTFAVTFAFGNLEGTFTTYISQHFGYTNPKTAQAVAGGVFAYIGVLIVVIQGGLIRPLVKRFGEAKLVVVGIGLMAAGFLLFPLAPLLAVLLIGPMLPIAIGSGLNSPALRALISRRATAQGAALGLVRLVRQPGPRHRPGHGGVPVQERRPDGSVLVRGDCDESVLCICADPAARIELTWERKKQCLWGVGDF